MRYRVTFKEPGRAKLTHYTVDVDYRKIPPGPFNTRDPYAHARRIAQKAVGGTVYEVTQLR